MNQVAGDFIGDLREIESGKAEVFNGKAWVPVSWQSRLALAGYAGSTELGPLIAACPKRMEIAPNPVQTGYHTGTFALRLRDGSKTIPPCPDDWVAVYECQFGIGPYGEAGTPEEAVANLLIKVLALKANEMAAK